MSSTSVSKLIKKHDILTGNSTRYEVLGFKGEGCFGAVIECRNLETDETVAIKIHKPCKDDTSHREIQMLQNVSKLNPDKNNIVKFIDNFMFQAHSCLAFEILDKSLFDLMSDRDWKPLSLNEMRPVAQQLLVAFDALRSNGIIHGDLKPDNVMLVNHKDEPFRVKLIDFGLALPAFEVRPGMTLQPKSYRAPEVILGLHISEAIDMWGLGCCLIFLYFGDHLFEGKTSYNDMNDIIRLLGQPDDHLLNEGFYSNKYFTPYYSCDDGKLHWRFKSAKEYQMTTGDGTRNGKSPFEWAKDLDDAILRCEESADPTEFTDRMAFLNLLKQLLCLDPDKRITPSEALKHPYVSLNHLLDHEENAYTNEALDLMEAIISNKLFNSTDSQSDTGDIQSSAVAGPSHTSPVFSKEEACELKQHHISSESRQNNLSPGEVVEYDTQPTGYIYSEPVRHIPSGFNEGEEPVGGSHYIYSESGQPVHKFPLETFLPTASASIQEGLKPGSSNKDEEESALRPSHMDSDPVQPLPGETWVEVDLWVPGDEECGAEHRISSYSVEEIPDIDSPFPCIHEHNIDSNTHQIPQAPAETIIEIKSYLAENCKEEEEESALRPSHMDSDPVQLIPAETWVEVDLWVPGDEQCAAEHRISSFSVEEIPNIDLPFPSIQDYYINSYTHQIPQAPVEVIVEIKSYLSENCKEEEEESALRPSHMDSDPVQPIPGETWTEVDLSSPGDEQCAAKHPISSFSPFASIYKYFINSSRRNRNPADTVVQIESTLTGSCTDNVSPGRSVLLDTLQRCIWKPTVRFFQRCRACFKRIFS